jgi:hypothetical protein
MRGIWFVVFLFAFAPIASADEAAIQKAISGQITAFEADDYAAAMAYASPAITALFGTPERFGQMVRTGYPMVCRPRLVEYLGLTVQGDRQIQQVLITDQAGALHVLAYYMTSTPAGWRISAVQILEAPQVGA